MSKAPDSRVPGTTRCNAKKIGVGVGIGIGIERKKRSVMGFGNEKPDMYRAATDEDAAENPAGIDPDPDSDPDPDDIETIHKTDCPLPGGDT